MSHPDFDSLLSVLFFRLLYVHACCYYLVSRSVMVISPCTVFAKQRIQISPIVLDNLFSARYTPDTLTVTIVTTVNNSSLSCEEYDPINQVNQKHEHYNMQPKLQ